MTRQTYPRKCSACDDVTECYRLGNAYKCTNCGTLTTDD